MAASAAAPSRLHWPSQCEVCRNWGSDRLCGACSLRFTAPVLRCQRCALRLGAGGPLCGGCLRDAPPFERAVCVADYGFPWDRLIASFKFQGRAELAWTLARRLASAVAAAPPERIDVVMPVPLSNRRLAERGYNQAWELARRVARIQQLPACADLLSRPIESAHQADLTRAQRLVNLRGAFMADPRRRERLAGRRIALVDDVLTTGATAREASQALLRAGAAAVHVWVIARTPEH